jgi:hypothetical protein
MRVRNLHVYQVLRLLADAIAVACAWRLTIALRILLNPVASQQVTMVESALWAPSLLIVLVLWSLLAWRLGHYNAPAPHGWHRNLLSIVEQSLLASMAVVSTVVFDRGVGVQASRAFMLIFLPTSSLHLRWHEVGPCCCASRRRTCHLPLYELHSWVIATSRLNCWDKCPLFVETAFSRV